jgi:hypothetical protein
MSWQEGLIVFVGVSIAALGGALLMHWALKGPKP